MLVGRLSIVDSMPTMLVGRLSIVHGSFTGLVGKPTEPVGKLSIVHRNLTGLVGEPTELGDSWARSPNNISRKAVSFTWKTGSRQTSMRTIKKSAEEPLMTVDEEQAEYEASVS
jgi:hypothetical protein